MALTTIDGFRQVTIYKAFTKTLQHEQNPLEKIYAFSL